MLQRKEIRNVLMCKISQTYTQKAQIAYYKKPVLVCNEIAVNRLEF